MLNLRAVNKLLKRFRRGRRGNGSQRLTSDTWRICLTTTSTPGIDAEMAGRVVNISNEVRKLRFMK